MATSLKAPVDLLVKPCYLLVRKFRRPSCCLLLWGQNFIVLTSWPSLFPSHRKRGGCEITSFGVSLAFFLSRACQLHWAHDLVCSPGAASHPHWFRIWAGKTGSISQFMLKFYTVGFFWEIYLRRSIRIPFFLCSQTKLWLCPKFQMQIKHMHCIYLVF